MILITCCLHRFHRWYWVSVFALLSRPYYSKKLDEKFITYSLYIILTVQYKIIYNKTCQQKIYYHSFICLFLFIFTFLFILFLLFHLVHSFSYSYFSFQLLIVWSLLRSYWMFPPSYLLTHFSLLFHFTITPKLVSRLFCTWWWNNKTFRNVVSSLLLFF